MNDVTSNARVGSRLGKPWPLIVIAGLLTFTPLLVAVASSVAGQSSETGLVAVRVAKLLDSLQSTVFVVVLLLTFGFFWRFLPVWWSLCRSSTAGVVIAAELALLFWLVYGGLADFGMPGIFWHQERLTVFFAAYWVTMFTFWMLYLLFIRDFDLHRYTPGSGVWARFKPLLLESGVPRSLRNNVENADAIGQLRWFLGVSGLPALILLVIPGVLPVVRPTVQTRVIEWCWLGGLLAGAATIALLVWARAATRLHELSYAAIGRSTLRGVIDLDADRLDPHANTKNILIIVLVLYAASYIDKNLHVNLMRHCPAAFSICVLLGVVATAATWFVTRSKVMRWSFVLVFVVMVSLVGSLDYEVEIRELSGLYPSTAAQFRRRVSPGEAKPASYRGVVDLQEFQRRKLTAALPSETWGERQGLLERWRRSFKAASPGSSVETKPILVVVTTSGGALRAAAWTESVLGRLEDTLGGDFPHHVRLITGASGGMLGAARFVVSQMHRREMPASVVETPPDYLRDIAWQIAFRDLVPNSLVPWALYNRGDSLEDAWAQVDEGINTTFGELRGAEEDGAVPSIIFSPMMPEDGRRLLISNLPLADLTSNTGRALLKEDHASLQKNFDDEQKRLPPAEREVADDYNLEYPAESSVSAVEFFRLFESSRAQLRLASAVRMSATFPYATSSVVIPTFPPRHAVDAGYYDNYGVNLAVAWVASHQKWISENTSGVLFVQIRAFPNERRLKMLDQNVLAPPTNAGDRGMIWSRFEQAVHAIPTFAGLVLDGSRSVVLPFEGIAEARDSSMFFRNDAELNALHEMFQTRTSDREFFRTVVFTCDTTPSDPSAPNVETLNWYMDTVEFQGIRRNMNAVSKDGRTGRLRNHLREEALINWWNSRHQTR